MSSTIFQSGNFCHKFNPLPNDEVDIKTSYALAYVHQKNLVWKFEIASCHSLYHNIIICLKY